MPIGQIDDDTAQIQSSKKELLINTDVLVEGVHFSELTTSAHDVGWKAITSNISDLASSGSKEIIGYTIGLVIPPNTTWIWIQEFYEGMKDAMEHFGGKLLGGDCSKGKEKVISITAFGELGGIRLHRANAMTGDYLVSSGVHGLSRLGLSLLKSEKVINKIKLGKNLKERAILAHKRPMPPVKALHALEACKPIELPWRAAGTDSSDGLINAIRNICESSNCQAVIHKKSIPKDKDWPTGNMWDEWCLNGGEDYKLILSLPEKWAKNFIKEIKSAKIIGSIKEGSPKVFWDDSSEINLNSKYKFQHF